MGVTDLRTSTSGHCFLQRSKRLFLCSTTHQFTNAAAPCRKFPTQKKAVALTFFVGTCCNDF